MEAFARTFGVPDDSRPSREAHPEKYVGSRVPHDVRRLLEVSRNVPYTSRLKRTGHLGRHRNVTLVSTRQLYVLYLANSPTTTHRKVCKGYSAILQNMRARQIK